MEITEINKLCLTALQNFWQITGHNLNLDMTTLPYTENNNNINVFFMAHL